jgi:hypothetical protein
VREIDQLDQLVRYFDEKFKGTYPPRCSNRTEVLRILISDKLRDIERVEKDKALQKIKEEQKALKALKLTQLNKPTAQPERIETLKQVTTKRLKKFKEQMQ